MWRIGAFLVGLLIALTSADATEIVGTAPAQKTYVFHLTIDQARIVALALTELPYKQSAPILVAMQQELNAQLKDDQKGASK